MFECTIQGTLMMINDQKKLIVEIDQKTFEEVDRLQTAVAKEQGYPDNWRRPYFRRRDGYFISLRLDRRDKRNLIKFKRLCGSTVFVDFDVMPYHFKVENEVKCGISNMLVDIVYRKSHDDIACTEKELFAVGDEVTKFFEELRSAPLSDGEKELFAVADEVTALFEERRSAPLTEEEKELFSSVE